MSVVDHSHLAEAPIRTQASARTALVPTDGDVVRLVCLLFIAPNVLLAAWLEWPFMALVWLGCAGAAALICRAHAQSALAARPADMRRLALCLAFGLVFCLIAGVGHVFYTERDWLVRDAVLTDLVRYGANTLYREGSTDYMMRAPLGVYLLPSVVGRAAGLAAAHVALLLQNATIVGIVAYFVVMTAGGIGRAREAALLLVLMGFSGLDILPILAAEANELLHGEPILPFQHTEWWGLYFSSIRMQYSSHVALAFWAMNHMAPGWWFATLSLLYVRGMVAFALLPISFAAMLLWSPLAMMGAAPLLAYFALDRLRLRRVDRYDLAAIGVGLAFLPVALYLTIDNGDVAKEWLVTRDGFLTRYLLHLLFEAPQAAIVIYAWRKVDPSDRRLLALALALLLVFPFYSIGLYNDFTMRASIAPLFILSVVFARIAVTTPRDGGRFASAISSIVLISAATPLLEMKVSLTAGRFEPSDCNLLTSWRKNEPTASPANYLARVEATPAWLMRPETGAPKTREDRKCWPDHPLLLEELK